MVALSKHDKLQKTFKVTESRSFKFGKDTIVVERENTIYRDAWRLVVNGKASPATTHYSGLLHFKGYFIATEYWEGYLLPIPFKAEYATEV